MFTYSQSRSLQNRRHIAWCLWIGITAVFVCSGSSVHAQPEKEWTGGSDPPNTNWSDDNNWDPEGAPTNQDDVQILLGGGQVDADVKVDQAAEANSLKQAGTLTLQADLDLVTYHHVGLPAARGVMVVDHDNKHTVGDTLTIGEDIGSVGEYQAIWGTVEVQDLDVGWKKVLGPLRMEWLLFK